MIVGVAWFSPAVVLASVAATVCLEVLRLLTDVRRYWFRLAATLLFAVPLPLFLLQVSGPETAAPVAAVQLVTALLIVQPREGRGGGLIETRPWKIIVGSGGAGAGPDSCSRRESPI